MDDLWLKLYRARDSDGLKELFHEHAHGARLVLAKLNNLLGGTLVLGWKKTAVNHLTGYRTFVQRWLTGTLTEEDWLRAGQWVKPKGKGQAEKHPFEWLAARPARFSFEQWLIEQMKTNPYQPFEEGYRQVLILMTLERAGWLPFRPLFCGGCGTLLMPVRQAQRFCSARCRFRVLQQQHRTARKKDAAKTRRRSGSKGFQHGAQTPSERERSTDHAVTTLQS